MNSHWTRRELVSLGKRLLQSPHRSHEAELLLSSRLRISKSELIVDGHLPVDLYSLHWFLDAVRRRKRGEPIQYITGEAHFIDLLFRVKPGVFVPRPETELLVGAVISRLRETSPCAHPLILDVGTGCGAIAVSLAARFPECRIWAVDLSSEALEVATENAGRYQVEERVSFWQGDLLEAILPRSAGRGDCLVCNPPYVPTPSFPHLPTEVRMEPRLALDGGRDGLEVYRRLEPQAGSWLKPGGLLAFELGDGQSSKVCDILGRSSYWSGISVLKDYNGMDRVVLCRRQ